MGGYTGSNGTYNLSGAGSLTVSGDEYVGGSGTGTFTQSGGGNTVSGSPYVQNGSYNLEGGTLTVGTVDLTGGVFSQRGGELQGSLVNQSAFNYFSGLFSGRLLNYGTLNLNGDFTAGNGMANYSTFDIQSGRTVILNGEGLDNQGALVVNGTLAGKSLLNDTAGALTGAGVIRGDLINSGTLLPGGASSDKLTINGNYHQTASGILTTHIASPTSCGRLNITGSARLGGALNTIFSGGYTPRVNQVFRILTATDGLTGTFSSLSVPELQSLTLFWQPLYTPTGFDLEVVRNFINPNLCLTFNQRQVANMLNVVGRGAGADLNDVLNRIDRLQTPCAVASAFQQISADKAASLANLGFAASDFFRQDLVERITNLRYGSPGCRWVFEPRGR